MQTTLLKTAKFDNSKNLSPKHLFKGIKAFKVISGVVMSSSIQNSIVLITHFCISQ